MSPLTFKQLKAYDGDAPEVQLKRKFYVQIAYNAFLARVKPADAILENIEKNYNNSRFIIMNNRFPYNVESGISHLVVWMNPEKEANENDVRGYLKFRGVEEFAMFMNKPSQQSIKAIKHYHLFVPNDYLQKIHIAE